MCQIGRVPLNEILLEAARYFHAQKGYLANLFSNTSGYESFERNMAEIHYERLKSSILGMTNSKELDRKTETYVRLYCMGTVRLTCEWILGRFSLSPDELAEVYLNSLPLPLRRYLCPE